MTESKKYLTYSAADHLKAACTDIACATAKIESVSLYLIGNHALHNQFSGAITALEQILDNAASQLDAIAGDIERGIS
jgi:hypothetical protein